MASDEFSAKATAEATGHGPILSALFATHLAEMQRRRRERPAVLTTDRFMDYLRDQENNIQAGYDAKTDRWYPHQDSRGLWTQGFGHLVGDGSSPDGEGGRFVGGQTTDEINGLLKEDVAVRGIRPAKRAVGLETWSGLPAWGKALLTEFAFSLGPEFHKARTRDGRKGFPRMVEAVVRGDVDAALREASDRTAGGKRLKRRHEALERLIRAIHASEVF